MIPSVGLIDTSYVDLNRQNSALVLAGSPQFIHQPPLLAADLDQLVLPGQTLPLPPPPTTDGRQTFDHPFFWSAFTMVGSPW